MKNKKIILGTLIGVLSIGTVLAIVLPLTLNSKKDNGDLVKKKSYTVEQLIADPEGNSVGVIKKLTGVIPFSDEADETKREEYFAAHYDAKHWMADILLSIRTSLLSERNMNARNNTLDNVVIFNKIESKGTTIAYDIHVSMTIDSSDYDIDFKSQKSEDDSSVAYLPYKLRSSASVITADWDAISSGQGERTEGTVDGDSGTGFSPYDGGLTFAGMADDGLAFTASNWKK